MSDTTQLSDQYLLQQELKRDVDVRVSTNKHLVYVPDGNQGSYQSGLIDIDATTALTGASGAAAISDGFLMIPYPVSMSIGGTIPPAPGVGIRKPFTRFSLAPKCGIWNFISSIQLELNGKKILTEDTYRSFWNNLRAQNECTTDYVKKHGAELFLAPDDWQSINFAKVANTVGDGYSNANLSGKVVFNPDLSETQTSESNAYNSGLADRLLNAPMIIDKANASPSFGWASFGTTGGLNIVQQSGRSCFKEYDVPAAGGVCGEWFYMLRVKLTDLHPIFKELNLLGSPQLKLRIRMNAGQFTVSSDGTGMKLDSVTMTSGEVNPIMLAPMGADNPLGPGDSAYPRLVNGTTLTVAFGPVQNALQSINTSKQYFPFNTLRLYVPFYELENPMALINNPTKKVSYLDCYTQIFRGKAGESIAEPTGQQNASFALQISGSHRNVKAVAVLPFADTRIGHFATAHNTPQWQSPFDSAPWTVCPGAYIRNFNVQIGNKNVFASSHDYDFESFAQEFSKLSAVNGDISRVFTSGLINRDAWSLAHRVMIADTSRISEKDVPASITISGINGSAQGLDLIVLVIYERELEYDRLTSEVYSFT